MNQVFEGKIAFIGGGNMAQALIGGLLSQEIKANRIIVAEPVAALRETLADRGLNVTADNRAAVVEADVVVLAVKPQMMGVVLNGIRDIIAGRVVISIAAGLSVATLSKMLGGYDRIVRAMPNTPSLVQTGATGLFAGAGVDAADRSQAAAVMGATGLVLWVEDEALMHAVTAVSGSGPAYFFYWMESMIAAGQQLGLTEQAARDLTLQTALGAAQMAITSGEHPAKLRQNVTSPNGTTQAALESMAANQVGELIKQALQAAADRSDVLSKELDRD
ncbi:MAG: pyrroline-5-carboxylate reductase [Pseudomonadota bacterium]|nr:pyrroline-5-carboxylate reductase [Pseudomonadota bacterium]